MTPNPGSPEAIEQGCKCPRYDNCHGDGYSIDRATGAPMFVVREDCPLHGTAPLTSEVVAAYERLAAIIESDEFTEAISDDE